MCDSYGRTGGRSMVPIESGEDNGESQHGLTGWKERC